MWAEVEGRVRMTRWERRAALLVGVLGLGVAAVGCGAPERQAGTCPGSGRDCRGGHRVRPCGYHPEFRSAGCL